MKKKPVLSGIFLTAALLLTSTTFGAPDTAAPTPCSSFKEYATALNFVRSGKSIASTESEARGMALKVAEGCSGAAGRFIQVVELLTKAQVLAKDAVEMGTEFAQRTDEQAKAFVSVFKKAFAAEELDLTIREAIDLARSISLQSEKLVTSYEKDFTKLAEFCVNHRALDLPKPLCAKVMTRVLTRAKPEFADVGESFIKAFTFATEEEKGPKLITQDALQLSEELVQVGPGAVANFIEGYGFAISEKGHQMKRSEALVFGKQMAALSVPRPAVSPSPSPSQRD